jgi:hypothetical protein
MTLRRALPIANLVACALFVVLREPADLSAADKDRLEGGMSFTSGIVGTLACRTLYSWSAWHGGEALGVKILEVMNAPALAATAAAHVIGEMTVARTISACRWSWVLAGAFLPVASIQWWLLGFVVERGWQRLGDRSR